MIYAEDMNNKDIFNINIMNDSSVVRINATENMNGYEFSISDMNDYVRNGVYNFTVKVSSLVIYFYPNNTEYYNNGKSVNVRYFNSESYRYCRGSNYSVSSYSIHGNSD